MIPQHVQDEYNKMTKPQQARFHELVAWAGGGEITGAMLPVDYNAVISMVKQMGDEPVVPIEPIIPDDPDFERMKPKKA